MESVPKTMNILIFALIFVVMFNYVSSEPIQDNHRLHLDIINKLESWFPCPVGWTLNSDSSKCLRVFNTSESWSESQDFCSQYEGDLVSLHSETDFVLVKSLIFEDTWIGLNELTTSGVPEWSDSSPVNFTSWAPGQPNNENNTEQCVGLSERDDFDFVEDACTDKKRFICQKLKDVEMPVYRCPESWIMNSASSKCFYVIDTAQSWEDSLNVCRAFAGDLASLHSEYDFILAKSLVSVDTWIGLNDLDEEGNMVWSDSSAVDYISWGPGQPDNQNDNQSCVDLHTSWNFDFDDDVCSLEESSLCQRIPDVAYHCPEGWTLNPDSSKCFHVVTAKHKWPDARDLCRDFGGNLASVHSEAELELVQSLLSEDTWIGLNDRDKEGNFVWADGSAVDFTSWASGEPNNKAGEDCVDLTSGSSYHFNDEDCNKKKRFLCQTIIPEEGMKA